MELGMLYICSYVTFNEFYGHVIIILFDFQIFKYIFKAKLFV